MVPTSMEKTKKKRTAENKVGKEVGRLVAKGKEVKDKNRVTTGTMGVEEEMMMDEEVGNMADQDGGDGVATVGQERKLNRDQPTREKRDEVIEYPCPNCYNMFPSVEILTDHFKNCFVINPEFKASKEMAKLKGGANPFDCGSCGKVLHIKIWTILHPIICSPFCRCTTPCQS